MKSWRSNAILALQIAGQLSLKNAVAADSIDPIEDDASPLIELVNNGTLPAEALAHALAKSSGRPRLRGNILVNYGLDKVYLKHQALCSRYQAIPVLLDDGPNGYLALAMVDPSWTSAAHAFEAHFRVPVRIFVISNADYIYLCRSELRPSAEDYFDFGETVDGETPTELLELVRALQETGNENLRSGDGRFADASNGRSALEPTTSVDVDASATIFTTLEAAEAARIAEHATFYDMAKELGYDDPDEQDDPHLNGITPRGSARVLQSSKAFETSRYVLVDTLSAMQALIERILEGPVTKDTWRDLFDVFSLIGCGCVLGLRNETEMFLADLWIDSAEVSRRDWALVGQMLHRVFPTQTNNLHVLQLGPRHRDELNIAGFVGTNVLLCTSACGDGSVAFFGLIGLPGEWIRELNTFMTSFSRGPKLASLLHSMNDPSTRLIHVV